MKTLFAVLAVGVMMLFAQEAYGQISFGISDHHHHNNPSIHLQIRGLHFDFGNPHCQPYYYHYHYRTDPYHYRTDPYHYRTDPYHYRTDPRHHYYWHYQNNYFRYR